MIVLFVKLLVVSFGHMFLQIIKYLLKICEEFKIYLQIVIKKICVVVTSIPNVPYFITGEGSLLDPCGPECIHEINGAYFPHPQDCTKFYQCNHHIAHLHNCSAHLYFNPTLNVCDFPEAAGCTADPDFDCEAGEPTTQPPTTPEGKKQTRVIVKRLKDISR